MEHHAVLTGPCIVTKYLGPTNHRGTRVKASCKRDSDTNWTEIVSWDYQLDAPENHFKVAQALVDSWPFEGLKIVARGHDHNHYYFITSCS